MIDEGKLYQMKGVFSELNSNNYINSIISNNFFSKYYSPEIVGVT